MKMKTMKNISLAVATIFTVQLSVTGIASAQVSAPQAVNSSYVAKASEKGFEASSYYAEVTIGQPYKLKLTYNGQPLDGALVAWTTSNSKFATVHNGIVSGYKEGTVIITGRYNGESIRIRASVSKEPTLDASSSSVSIRKGQQQTITLKYNNKTIDGIDASWSSSNESVATVKRGVVTAKASGTTVITATYKGKSVDISVKVTANQSGKLEASESKISLKKGERQSIKLTYEDEKLAGSKAEWKSSKTSVATVDDDGVITAKGKGTATVTAEYKGYKIEIEVKVDSGDESGDLEASETKLKMKKGEEETITLRYDGEKIKGNKAEWKSSKSSVASVDDDGTITAKNKGTATITASYKGEEVKIEVTVGTKSGSDLLEADDTSLSLKKGDKETITLKYDGKKLVGSKASWSTSKSSVATVSNSGKVTAKAKGTATITASYKGEEVEIKVTVK